jgi:Transposase, Mutator family
MVKGKRARPAATREHLLEPLQTRCAACGGGLWVAYHNTRTVMTLAGLCRLTLRIRRCPNAACPRYHQAYRPEEEGAWALPHSEFGLDVIALIGSLRYRERRSVPELHAELQRRGVRIAERSVTHLLHRYEELVALHLADTARLQERLRAQGEVILAIDGLQPDVGHEVLWVLREVRSGEVLLARSLLGSSQADLTPLLAEVRTVLQAAAIPIRGVISDGQRSRRQAIAAVFPGVPHQLCQFHYLREAATPIYEADRHAKKELKKQVRGIRPMERALEARSDAHAEAIRGYCLAVRSALTDDGRPPLAAPGLKLHDRLQASARSLDQVEAGAGKGGCRRW